MFQRCLICTNFADGLYRLVEFVPSLAANGIQTIIFLHSVPLWEEGEIPRIDEEGIAHARSRLQAGLKNIPKGVEVHIEVLSGRPVDTIPKVAKNYKVDVILTGMESRNFLQEKLFGSTTAELARNYTTPLLILRPQLVSTYTCEELALRCQHLFRYFLIPYNGGKASEYLLQKVKTYAEKRPDHSLSECLLIWVIEEWRRKPVSKEQQVEVAQETLQGIKGDLEALGLQVKTEVRVGNPYLEVLEAATVFDISMIAVSSETIGSIIELPVRSFAGELMRRSWHPVLFFPPPPN